MIRFLEILSDLLAFGYAFVFFWMIQTFLPLRKNPLLRIAAFFACTVLSTVVIYSNDLAGLLGTLLGFSLYIVLLHSGHPAKKLTAVLVFYPSLIAINYLMQDIGSRFFFSVSGAPGSPSLGGWDDGHWLISTAIHTLSLLLRLFFWIFAWLFLRKYLSRNTSQLTVKMWLLVDTLMLSPFVAIFTVIYFMPENPLIVWPICSASVFSSFGCLYLASYICTSVQTAYRAHELEQKQAYYHDRLETEQRVRGIYHDLKNHLLLLSAQAGNGPNLLDSIAGLQSQIQEYENYYHTGNDFLDIIIRDKASAAQARQIDFSAAISFADGSFIEPFDISTIFGNALDNAIEASEKLPADERLITVKAERIRNMLVIRVENNAPADTAPDGPSTKADGFLHGFGLANIKAAVQKYDGHWSVAAENGVFALKLVIPLP